MDRIVTGRAGGATACFCAGAARRRADLVGVPPATPAGLSCPAGKTCDRAASRGRAAGDCESVRGAVGSGPRASGQGVARWTHGGDSATRSDADAGATGAGTVV